MDTITTEQLIIRPLALSDANFVLTLFNQKNCLKFIGDKNIHSIEGAENYLIHGPLKSYQQHGVGLMAVCLKSKKDHKKNTEQVIGVCGLLKRKELDFNDLGYAILERYYRQGYTFEAVHAVVEHYTNIKTLLALTDENNASSQKLLLKLGFDFLKISATENEKKSCIYQFKRN